MLRAAVPVLFCVLVFFFALHAKTAVYGAATQTKVTPSTSSKMWVSGQKMDARVLPPSAVPLFCAVVSLLLFVLLNQPRLQVALRVPPPSNLRLRHLHRFLRPPPFQS
jgi:hypothetical protein